MPIKWDTIGYRGCIANLNFWIYFSVSENGDLTNLTIQIMGMCLMMGYIANRWTTMEHEFVHHSQGGIVGIFNGAGIVWFQSSKRSALIKQSARFSKQASFLSIRPRPLANLLGNPWFIMHISHMSMTQIWWGNGGRKHGPHGLPWSCHRPKSTGFIWFHQTDISERCNCW